MVAAELYKEKRLNLIGFLSCFLWLHGIHVYDYGKLKVLIFGLDEDGRSQVKVNGWTIFSAYGSFSFYAIALAMVHRETIMDEIFHVVGQSLVDFGINPQCENKIINEANHDGIKGWEICANLIWYHQRR